MSREIFFSLREKQLLLSRKQVRPNPSFVENDFLAEFASYSNFCNFLYVGFTINLIAIDYGLVLVLGLSQPSVLEIFGKYNMSLNERI